MSHIKAILALMMVAFEVQPLSQDFSVRQCTFRCILVVTYKWLMYPLEFL